MNRSASHGRPEPRRSFPALAGVDHSFFEVDGLRLHVAEAGRGEPLVLLHGFPQHWYAWRRVVPLLADRYHLICPDLAGYGWSAGPGRGYGTDDRVSSLVGLLDALGIDRANFIGHEAGGWIGLVAALDHPERFSRLVALNIVPPWTSRRRLLVHAWRNWHTGIIEQPFLGRVALRRGPALVRFLLRHYSAEGTWETAALDEFATALAVPCCARACELQHRRFVIEDIPKLLLGRFQQQRLAVPTLLVTGEEDFFFPPSLLRGMDLGAADLTIRSVAGAGHYLAEERPELVATMAAEFFGHPNAALHRPSMQGSSD